MNTSFLAGVVESLLKTAALTRRQMHQAMKRLDFRYGHRAYAMPIPKKMIDLKREYRDVLRSQEPIQVPLSERLKSYKHWKATGEVPAIKKGKAITEPSSFVVDRPMHLSTSREPLDLTSFGTKQGFRGALRRPKTRLDRNYVLPGKQHAERFGIYTYPKELSERGRGYARKAEGTPARLDIKMPAHRVLQSRRERPEVIIPASTIREHLGRKVSRL